MKPAPHPALLCVLLLLAPPALAQDGFGVLCGSVFNDYTQDLQPGVVVTATSPNLQGEQTVITDENGFYRIPQLPPGNYTLRFEYEEAFEEYSPRTVTAVVRLNQTYRVNVRLMRLGDVEEYEEARRPVSVPVRRWRPLPRPAQPPPFGVRGGDTAYGRGKLVPWSHTTSDAVLLERYFQGDGVNPTVETRQERFSSFPLGLDLTAQGLSTHAMKFGEFTDEHRVRVEQIVNSVGYGYERPTDAPFAVHVEGFPSPSRPGYHVLRVGLQAREVPGAQRKDSHWVFVIDVSSSMGQEHRIERVSQAIRLLVDALDARARVSIVAYGGHRNDSGRLLMRSSSVLERGLVLWPPEVQREDGTANVQSALDVAYEAAIQYREQDGLNRVILFSDGVAHNGLTGEDGLWARVKDFASRGITLSTVGVGMGASRDALMERLAEVGGGRHAYVDTLDEEQRGLVRDLLGPRPVVARGVKVRLEFDPGTVERYRLVGYEHRFVASGPPREELGDGDEVVSGHAVTALYEVKLRGPAGDLGTLRLSYKAPEGGGPEALVKALPRGALRASFASASPSARLAYVAAAYAEKLRTSYWVRPLSWQRLVELFEQVDEPLASQPQVRNLGYSLRQAASADRRADRFEPVAPLATMDFDRPPGQ